MQRGRNLTLPALDVPLSEVRSTFEANVFAVILMNQVFAPLLIRASPSLILNIGSVAAVIPYVYSSVYNASKAALHSYSDTLRLELEPFGVRVMETVTGGVKSSIGRTERILPEGSLYRDVQSSFDDRLANGSEEDLDAGVYAREVVREALRREPKKEVWKGYMADTILWVWNFGLGGWLFGWYMRRLGGLGRLKEIVRRKTEEGKKEV